MEEGGGGVDSVRRGKVNTCVNTASAVAMAERLMMARVALFSFEYIHATAINGAQCSCVSRVSYAMKCVFCWWLMCF